MQLNLYQVDAFTNRPFGGNPAAVVPLREWLPDETMQAIALENNLSETAFFVPRGDGEFDLRWSTPLIEVDLCGHATPAGGIDEDPVTGSSHCILIPYWAERLGKTKLFARQVSSRGGALWCALKGERVSIAGHAAPYMEGSITIKAPNR